MSPPTFPTPKDALTQQQEYALFLELLSLPPEQQERFIAERARSPQLAERLRSLLRQDAQSDSALGHNLDGVLDQYSQSGGGLVGRGDRLGVYEVGRRIGVGGMAEVWAVQQTRLGSHHAMKVLLWASAPLKARLLREGRAQARLRHPNVVPVSEIIELGGIPALVMPLVYGPSLRSLLNRSPLAPDEALALFSAILDGVACAHSQGLVHRDLKPGNVLLDVRSGEIVPRVADFGLVKEIDGSVYTAAGAVMGTPAYAAPEQLVDASTADARADLFALGVMLCEMLTGHRPFSGDTLEDFLDAHDRPPDLEGLAPPHRAIVEALLVIDPAGRLPSCAELRARLGEVEPQAMRSARLVGMVRSLVPEPIEQIVSGGQEERRHNLSAPRDAFIGRQDDLGTLRQHLGEGTRLVSLVGTAGLGKSRLALELARGELEDAAAQWPGGVWFISLAEVTSRAGILTAVAGALGLKLGRAPEQQLVWALQGRGRMLMILDNFEQLVAHAPDTLGRWLDETQEARFVVTSRTLLGLRGERVFALDLLSDEEAIALFAVRAREVRSDFAIDDTSRPAVASLVSLLDRLPLAIELASARISVMNPAKMLQRMNQRFRLLTSQRPTAIRRQATLRAAIDWSWELLEDWEKAAFAQCAVFEGGFSLEAAEEVLDLDAFDGAPWGVDAVQSLVTRSMLRPLGENALGELRFGMLMSIHEYAREKLAEQDDAAVEACRRRHMALYSALGSPGQGAMLKGHGGGARWWALREEADNLRAASRCALRLGAGAAAAQTAVALFRVAERQQAAPALPVLTETLALLRRLELPAQRARVQRSLGRLLESLGRMDEALAHITEALDTTRRQQPRDRRGEGSILLSLGNLHAATRRPDEALASFTEALAIFREVGDRDGEGYALGNLGSLQRALGQEEAVEAYLTQALEIHREIGNRRGEGLTLGNLGSLRAAQGQLEEARELLLQARAIAQEVGNRRGEGYVLRNLGILHGELGRLEEAAELFAQTIQIHREVGNRHIEGHVRSSLGELHMKMGQLQAARGHLQQAVDIARDLGDRRGEAEATANLGLLLEQKGRPEQARELLSRARDIAQQLGDHDFVEQVDAHLEEAASADDHSSRLDNQTRA